MSRYRSEPRLACSSSHASLHDAQSPARLPEEDHAMIQAWSESIRTSLDGPHRGWDIGMTSEEDDRQRSGVLCPQGPQRRSRATTWDISAKRSLPKSRRRGTFSEASAGIVPSWICPGGHRFRVGKNSFCRLFFPPPRYPARAGPSRSPCARVVTTDHRVCSPTSESRHVVLRCCQRDRAPHDAAARCVLRWPVSK